MTINRLLPTTLWIVGGVTMLCALQFIAPAMVLSTLGMHVCSDAGLFFARHWGIVVFCLGGLMCYSASHLALRLPVMLAVVIEKLALVLMVATNLSNPALKGMHSAAIFDALCVVLLSILLPRTR